MQQNRQTDVCHYCFIAFFFGSTCTRVVCLDPRYHRIMNVTLSITSLLPVEYIALIFQQGTKSFSVGLAHTTAACHVVHCLHTHLHTAYSVRRSYIYHHYIDIYIALRIMAQPEFDMQGETPQRGSPPAPTSISEDTKGWCSECWSRCTFNTNWDKANSTQSICLYISRS